MSDPIADDWRSRAGYYTGPDVYGAELYDCDQRRPDPGPHAHNHHGFRSVFAWRADRSLASSASHL
jgi:hypothetical protein